MNFSIGANQSNSTAVNTTPNGDRHTSPLATGLNSLINTYVSQPLTDSASITHMLDEAGHYLDTHPEMGIQFERDFRTLLNLHMESAPARDIDLMQRFLTHRSTISLAQPTQNPSRDPHCLPTTPQTNRLGQLNRNLLQYTAQFMNANDILTLGTLQKKTHMAMRQSLDFEISAQKYSTEIKKQLAGPDEQKEYETFHDDMLIQSMNELRDVKILDQMPFEVAQKLPSGAQERFWRESAKS